MIGLFDYRRLNALAQDLAGPYQRAQPFPHAIIDDAADATLLGQVVAAFPAQEQLPWYAYDNPLERKFASNHLDQLPMVIREALVELNSGSFAAFLQRLTGIDGLLPDPEYNGGGLHRIERGGKLDIHADYNYHFKTKLDRRLNVLLYLNERWQESYGGHLEFWDAAMSRAVVRVLPVFNRLVVFNTTDTSYHGHPVPLACPPERCRRSIAVYYYSNGRPEHERSAPHSTLYQKRPGDPDDPELDQLRAKRARGRLGDAITKPKT